MARAGEESPGARGRLHLELAYDHTASLLRCHIRSAKDLASHDFNGKSDPYIKLEMRHPTESPFGTVISEVHPSTLAPRFAWDSEIDLIDLEDRAAWRLNVELWDRDRYSNDDFMGCMSFGMDEILAADGGLRWYYLLDKTMGAEQNLPTVQMTPMRSSRPLSSISYWKDNVEQDIYESLSKTERYRQESISELLRTEKSYVADLDLITETYTHDKFRNILQDDEHAQMLDCIPQLREASIVFILRLESLTSPTGVVSKCGEALAEYLPAMEPIYTRYCKSNEPVAAMIHRKLESSPDFRRVWEECKATCANMDLYSFRLKPLQRITKYRLLFNEIDTHTAETHPDKGAISRAAADCAALVSRVNEHVRAAELEVLWKQVCPRLILPPHLQSVVIRQESAMLCHCEEFVFVKTSTFKKPLGTAIKSSKSSDLRRRVLLMEDAVTSMPFLLITQIQSDTQEYVLYPRLPLENIALKRAVDLSDANADTDLIMFIPTPWKFETRDRHVLVLRSGSALDTKEFLASFGERQRQLAAGNVTPSTIEEVIGYVGELRSQVEPLTADQAKLLRASLLVQGLAERAKRTEEEHSKEIARMEKQSDTMVELIQHQDEEHLNEVLDEVEAEHAEEIAELQRRIQELTRSSRPPVRRRHSNQQEYSSDAGPAAPGRRRLTRPHFQPLPEDFFNGRQEYSDSHSSHSSERTSDRRRRTASAPIDRPQPVTYRNNGPRMRLNGATQSSSRTELEPYYITHPRPPHRVQSTPFYYH